jgi:hypothetical protein
MGCAGCGLWVGCACSVMGMGRTGQSPACAGYGLVCSLAVLGKGLTVHGTGLGGHGFVMVWPWAGMGMVWPCMRQTWYGLGRPRAGLAMRLTVHGLVWVLAGNELGWA